MELFKNSRVRALAAAGVLTVAAASGTAVIAVNAQQPTPTPGPAATRTPNAAAQQAATDHLNRLATNLGVSVDKLKDALKQTALQEVDAALAAGRITSQQAQQARDRINSSDGAGFGFGFGFGGPGGPGRGGPGGPRGVIGADRDQLAQFLGITADQLKTELNGKSLAQVAQAHGKTRDALIQFLTTSEQQRLASEVSSGRLTQAQADQRLTDFKNRVGQMVDAVHQQRQHP